MNFESPRMANVGELRLEIFLDRHRSWSFLRLGIGLEMRERDTHYAEPHWYLTAVTTEAHCCSELIRTRTKPLGEMLIRSHISYESSEKQFCSSSWNLGFEEMRTISYVVFLMAWCIFLKSWIMIAIFRLWNTTTEF